MPRCENCDHVFREHLNEYQEKAGAPVHFNTACAWEGCNCSAYQGKLPKRMSKYVKEHWGYDLRHQRAALANLTANREKVEGL